MEISSNVSNGLSHQSVAGYLTIIPRARVGYEMIDSQRGAYCFIKNNQEIMLHLAEFALPEQTGRQFNARFFLSMV